MRKKLFLVTNQSNANSSDGNLPKVRVSLAAAPWDDDTPHVVIRERDPLTRPSIKIPSLARFFDPGRTTTSLDDQT